MNTVGGLPRTVLRVHRPALVLWGAFVAVVAGLLVRAAAIEAGRNRAELARCAHHGDCHFTAVLSYGDTMRWTGLALCFSFCAVAAWAGASLIARELESGTAQLAWTQSVTPVRWLTAKLAVPALALALGGAVLVPLFRWSWSNNPDRLDDGWSGFSTFVALGPATVAYALCALAVGALAGLLLGRALPALGVTLAVMLLLNQILGTFRADLWPKVTRTGVTAGGLPHRAWQLESGVLVHGHRVANPDYGYCAGTAERISRCDATHGITGRYAVYHPVSHFWPLHLVETGIVLAVAATATATAFRLLRRRTA
ncbi:ABC transporter permease [Streptomyces sp. NPDC005195]|uniref:ABC transporter permease n=1 Tax=Streptomyces sp. NPDC005195 TaxID=3154561 RepID=UPI0033B37408